MTVDESSSIPLETARNKLLLIWMSGAGVLFTLLTLQSIFGRYGEGIQAVWSWFLPNVIPNLSLMIGVVGATAIIPAKGRPKSVRRSFFRISAAFSTLYLVLLSLTVFLEPLTETAALDLYTASNYWLSPLQGLVSAALGVLFVSQETSSRAPTSDRLPPSTDAKRS